MNNWINGFRPGNRSFAREVSKFMRESLHWTVWIDEDEGCITSVTTNFGTEWTIDWDLNEDLDDEDWFMHIVSDLQIGALNLASLRSMFKKPRLKMGELTKMPFPKEKAKEKSNEHS
tara:strand:- start:4645 stop:4995 length:351 start_codon:yes stop_codon:yes gene_type:complete